MNNKSVYRPIAIPLNDKFEYVHATHDENEQSKHLFVGRKRIIERLLSLLKSENRKRGSYLITGYRGVGKTSVINKVLDQYQIEQKGKKSLVVRINLGDNSQLTPLNIYFSIVNILREEISNSTQPSIKKLFASSFMPVISLPSIVNLFIYLLLLLGSLLIWNYLMPDQVVHSVSTILLLLLLLSAPVWLQSIEWNSLRINNPELDLLTDINELIERMSYEISEAKRANFSYLNFGFGSFKNKTKLPIHAREAEDQLLRILDQLNRKGIKVIFVLDEIDKLSDHEELSEIHYNNISNVEGDDKINRINTLLGSLKNFVTTAHATFFFISGRETLDRYYSEKGSPNSLYESLFDQVFEIPSLLTDEGEIPKGTQLSSLIEEYVCRRIERTVVGEGGNELDRKYTLHTLYQCELRNRINEIKDNSKKTQRTKEQLDKEIEKAKLEIRFYINFLRSFIHFLTFHSWGNPKRLNTIFESFIVPVKTMINKFKENEIRMIDEKIWEAWKNNENEETFSPKYWLLFNNGDKFSFSLTSEITTLFQHQLSREVSRISDKLTVSAFSSLHFILKLHSYGFSRETLHRMSETINIYRSPELNTIVDDLLTNVFKPYIRRIRNGMYRYRFHSGFEQELRYISHVFELESASYNFSLNSMKHVKRFFNDVLTNTNDEEIGVISRTHIILGDMSSIEQSYNAASEHYSIATRILRNVLTKNSTSSRVNLINYIEVLLKQGDLSEHRLNYGRAAALYSEAENIVKKYIDHFQLSDCLNKGDSKWDLLKQPFWASRYLSLKRSPRPFKGDLGEIKQPDRPNYLYRDSDPRFYNFSACLLYFLGDAKSAAEAYSTTLKLTRQSKDLLLPDERISFLRNYARVGIVESTLIYRSRELFKNYLINHNSSKGKLHDFLTNLLKLATKQVILFSESLPEEKLSVVLEAAADDYEKNRLYISTVITCIKTISYFTTILDSFSNCTFPEKSEENLALLKLVDTAHKLISRMGLKAVRCIDKARQLESSQSMKTLMVYDYHGVPGICDQVDLTDITEREEFTKLIDWLLRSDIEQNSAINGVFPINEVPFLQPSLWLHKLTSTLMWFNYVRSKLLNIGAIVGGEKRKWFPELSFLPELGSISLRPGIFIRWIYARYKLDDLIEKMYLKKDEYSSVAILEKINTANNKSIFNNTRYEFTSIINYEEDEILEDAYEISRYLYFAVHQSRIISRKNMDLIFPRLSQIYHIQWRLLTNLMIVLLLKNHEGASNGKSKKFSSIREITFPLQMKLISKDNKYARHERIPPSYFDYEYIYLRLEESLESSANLVDRTSRSHMSVFQHKYFCHDDHNDQEFHMDYTLAYMFTPMALCFRDQIKETHENFKKAVSNGY